MSSFVYRQQRCKLRRRAEDSSLQLLVTLFVVLGPCCAGCAAHRLGRFSPRLDRSPLFIESNKHSIRHSEQLEQRDSSEGGLQKQEKINKAHRLRILLPFFPCTALSCNSFLGKLQQFRTIQSDQAYAAHRECHSARGIFTDEPSSRRRPDADAPR